MLKEEYIQLAKELKGDLLLELVKRFFLFKYKGETASIDKCEWANTFILTILRNGSEIKRFAYVPDVTDDIKSFIDANLPQIAEHANEKVFHKLECFCLSDTDNQETLIEYADLEFGITLDIFSANVIGDAIENDKTLKDFLISNSSSYHIQPAKFNQKDKILYDLFTTGNKIADLKNSFISSYIQYYLLVMGPQKVGELKKLLMEPLPNLSSRAFDDAFSRCIKDEIIHYDNGKYALKDDYKIKLEEIRAVTTATEERLLRQFEECLDEYGLKGMSRAILEAILEIYKAQNNSELAALNHTDDSEMAERKLVISLFDSLIKKGIDKKDANIIVKKVLDIISDSEYLNKVSATTLFTSLFNSDSLENFLGTQKRIVYLDTQILLQFLCVDYQDVPYDDSLYEAGKILYKQLKESENYLSLFTTSDYIREISNHLYEAYNLKRFVNVPFVKDFGPSKNIFYNFFLYLSELEGSENFSYEDYMEDLLDTDDKLPDDYYGFVTKADSLVVSILNNIGVVIKAIDTPSNLTVFRKDYDFILGNHPKGSKARDNDVLCMHFLSDQTNFINTEGFVDEPYLITLDTTIIPMRKKLVENYQRAYWYIYPPLKFANRLSIMNLKLDSKKINYDIICMAETNFKASYDTISMLDIMSKFFKKDDIGNKKLPRMLAKMKAEERNSDFFREYADNNSNNSPIDVVLNNIHRHYRKQGLQNLDNISKLFEQDELSDQIISLLKESCNTVLKSNHVEERIYKELDLMIEQQKAS